MANWLVIDNFSGYFSTDGSTRKWKAGDIINDTIHPTGMIAALQPAGLIVIPYNAATMATAVARFLEQHGQDAVRPSILPTLGAYNLNPQSILSGAGVPGATVGTFGQLYRDTTNGTWYINSSNPSGASWISMADQSWANDAILTGVGWRETVLDPVQFIDGAAGGIAPAILLSITGQPTATDTLVITDGVTPETYTFVAVAALPFDVTIGGTLAETMANLVATIIADSALVAAAATQGLDFFFATTPADQVVICNQLAVDTDAETLRIYATLTGTGAIQVVDFIDAGRYSYDVDAATEAAVPVADPAASTFGLGRETVDLVVPETHNALSVRAGYSWDADAQIWNRTIVVGPSLIELASTAPGTEGAALVGTDTKTHLGAATNVEAALEFLDDGQYDPGSVACLQIIQAGLPLANDTITIGADVYEADGVGANINFAIVPADANGTFVNLFNAIVANGTENFFADQLDATHIRLRSADAPQGTVIAANPNVVLADAMTNYVFDCGAVNVNTLAGRVPGQLRIVAAEIAVNAGHIAAGELRISFDAPVVEALVIFYDATNVAHAIGTDSWAIDNGDVLVTLPGGGAPDLIATDIIRVLAAL
jgi:hypothetical protein